MTLATYDFENGTDGALLTSALTGGHVYGSNGHFTASEKMHGSLGCVYSHGDLYHRVGFAFTPSAQIAIRYGLKISTDWDATIACVGQICDTSDAQMLSISWNGSSGFFDVEVGGASVGGTHVTATAGSWYRVEVVADASAGSASYSVYAGDSTTAVGSLTTASGLSFGGTQFGQFDVGIPSASGLTAGSVYFDDVAWSPGATSEIGPYTAPPASTTVWYIANGDGTGTAATMHVAS